MRKKPRTFEGALFRPTGDHRRDTDIARIVCLTLAIEEEVAPLYDFLIAWGSTHTTEQRDVVRVQVLGILNHAAAETLIGKKFNAEVAKLWAAAGFRLDRLLRYGFLIRSEL